MRVEDLMTIQEAARTLNITRASLYYAIETGKIKAVDVGGRKMLVRSDVGKYQPAGYRDRRPSKKQAKQEARES